MIDRTKPLIEQPAGEIRALLDALHANRERYDRANRIVEARSCELEIAEATRALAIINRRATEAEDQRVAEELAGHVVALSQPDRVRLRRVRDLLQQQPVHWDLEEALLDRLLAAAEPTPAPDVEHRVLLQSAGERIAELEVMVAQREDDLREAFAAGWLAGQNHVEVGEGVQPSSASPESEVAAAEYARSKVGA